MKQQLAILSSCNQIMKFYHLFGKCWAQLCSTHFIKVWVVFGIANVWWNEASNPKRAYHTYNGYCERNTPIHWKMFTRIEMMNLFAAVTAAAMRCSSSLEKKDGVAILLSFVSLFILFWMHSEHQTSIKTEKFVFELDKEISELREKK